MAEETAAVESQTGGEQVSDQAQYANDAFDSYFQSPDERDAAKEKQEKQPEPKKVAAKPQAETPKAGEKKADVTPKEKEKPNPIDEIFAGDDGAFDASKFLGFDIPKFGVDAPAPEQNHAPEAPEVPEWQQRVEADKQYEMQLKTTVGGITDAINTQIAQGVAPQEAIKTVMSQYDQVIRDHMEERRRQNEAETLSKIEARALERERAVQTSQRALSNTNEVVASLPGKDTAQKTALFNEIMFSDNGAKDILNRDFRAKHPGIDKMPESERAKLATKFLNEVSANKSELAHYFKVGYNNIRASKLPEMMQKARLAQSAMDKANALSAQKAPGGTLNRPNQNAAPDVWQNYLENHHQYADRV